MERVHNTVSTRKKIWWYFLALILIFLGLAFRLAYLMIDRADYYGTKATDLHERERKIKAARGRILDCNGVVLADNRTVCSISVIHNQITDPERVIACLSAELELSEEFVRKRVEKYSSMERIKSNVSKEVGDRIRKLKLNGVKVDEDYKRDYPYHELASKVLGFTGTDNQGIIGLEVKYEEYLKGSPGLILTMTDARGIELEKEGERRIEPIDGYDLHLTLDRNIQTYATQLAEKAMESKQADRVEILVMNPKNGAVLAMVNVPEFDLNDPYGSSNPSFSEALEGLSDQQKSDLWNARWRNACINDTYEPGSTFKIITASAGLEEGVIDRSFQYYCPGYIMVEDRRIRCHKIAGHGSEDFTHCMMNSCNPALITVGLLLGKERYYDYFSQFGLLNRTGVDLPGEAGTIMHRMENMGPVELATVAFGQSFQVTPIRLLTTVSALINGGYEIRPHLEDHISDQDGNIIHTFPTERGRQILSEETSGELREILEMVVSEGTGSNGKVAGYRVGGKTATSQTLPRGSGKYIASYIGFAPADDPQVIAIAIVHNPSGVYYGGQVAAPIIRQLYENILPYLGISGTEEEGGR